MGEPAENILWLIKKDDAILGPFTTDEIQYCIINREITHEDWIASPFGSFVRLQTCVQFQQFLLQATPDEDTQVLPAPLAISQNIKISEDPVSQDEINDLVRIFADTEPKEHRVEVPLPLLDQAANSSENPEQELKGLQITTFLLISFTLGFVLFWYFKVL